MANKIIFFADCGKTKIPSFLDRFYSFAKKISFSYDYLLRIVPKMRHFAKKNELMIIAFDIESMSLLNKAGFDPTLIMNYDSPILDRGSSERAMKIVKSLPEKNRLFGDSVDYKGISLWSIQEIDSWGSFFQRAIKNLNLIEAVIKKEKPDKVVIQDVGSFNNKLVYEFCIKNNVRIELIKSKSKIKSRIMDVFKLPAAKSISYYGLRKLSAVKDVKQHLRKINNKRILILGAALDSVELTNHLYKHLINKHDVLLSSIKDERRNYPGMNYSNFENYIDKMTFSVLKKQIKKFSSCLATLKKDKAFINAFNYKGVNLWPAVNDLLFFYYNVRFPELVFLIEIINNVIKIERPDLIILFDDIGVFGKTAANVCRINKISCLTLQHGIFGDLPIMDVVSDKLAAYGDFIRKIMIKRGVSPEKIVVTGNPKFDLLLSKHYSKKSFYKKFKIPDNFHLVVLATSTFLIGTNNKKIVSSMIDCIKKLKKVKLIIKLHPTEDNLLLYKSLAKKSGLDVIILQKYDIYEILNASDVLVTTSSTVGLEAMISGKPVININITNTEELIPYAKSKAAIGVSNVSELYSALYNSLYNRKILKTLHINMKKFIYEHAFRVDGKSTNRILLLVDDMLGEK